MLSVIIWVGIIATLIGLSGLLEITILMARYLFTYQKDQAFNSTIWIFDIVPGDGKIDFIPADWKPIDELAKGSVRAAQIEYIKENYTIVSRDA